VRTRCVVSRRAGSPGRSANACAHTHNEIDKTIVNAQSTTPLNLMILVYNFNDSAMGNHKNDCTQITILALRGSDRLPKNSDSDRFSDKRWGCC
jgi:hypothetical protein